MVFSRVFRARMGTKNPKESQKKAHLRRAFFWLSFKMRIAAIAFPERSSLRFYQQQFSGCKLVTVKLACCELDRHQFWVLRPTQNMLIGCLHDECNRYPFAIC
jgi:hypothetical protein